MTTDHTPPATWIDGHPHLEAIAAAVWERCDTENGLVVDDPRNIALAALAALAAVLPPPADQTALRDRIAEALMRWAEGNNAPQYASVRRPETVRANAYSRADAVLAVLPPPADRAAILREAAEVAKDEARHLYDDMGQKAAAGARLVEDRLRRMADETQPAQPPALDLTDAERNMLTYALDQAQERIWSEGGFTDADQAAVDSLRRRTAAERQDGAQP